jgi:hypothetical protein
MTRLMNQENGLARCIEYFSKRGSGVNMVPELHQNVAEMYFVHRVRIHFEGARPLQKGGARNFY